MTTEITYAEVKIQNDPKSLDTPNETKPSDTPNEPKSSDTPNEPKSSDTPNEPKSSDTPNEPKSLDTALEVPVAPKEKRNSLQSKTDFHKLLISLLLTLLLAISFFIAFVVTSHNYSMLKEKMETKEKKWSCCPENWKLFGSNCYFISTKETTWEESKKNCEEMQAHLLVIRSKEEQDFITEILNKATSYIGLSRTQDNSRWQWVDKTPYNNSISFWFPGEPNGEDENCVALHFRDDKWGWNDVTCDRRHKSICKMMKYSL